MSKRAFRVVVLGAVIGLLGVASYALAGGGRDRVVSSVMSGYEENPDISTVAKGTFDVQIGDADTTLTYKLSYSGLEGDVQQAHIHFGKLAINGGISVFLCSNLGNGPTGTQSCPHSGTVRGTLAAANVVGPVGQGIEPQSFAELVAAIRAGHTYANVHSTKWPAGEIRAQIPAETNNRRQDDGKGNGKGKGKDDGKQHSGGDDR